MQASPPLSAAFTKWVIPRLRALVHARSRDAHLGRDGADNFLHLLSFYMSEFDNQPFAQPDFIDNLSASGGVCLSADTLRQRAENFMRSNSDSHRVALLTCSMPEGGGSICEASLITMFTAVELWAMTEQPHLRELTCLELGVHPTTPRIELQRNFVLKFEEVIEREFALLSGSDREAWHKLAQERERATDGGETDMDAMQDLQGTISKWMFHSVCDKLVDNPVGNMVIQWSGFYVAAQDNSVKRFRGQVSTYVPCERWFDLPDYMEYVEPAWLEYIGEHTEGEIITKLPQFPCDAAADLLPEYRTKMKTFLEELFKLYCRLEDMDCEAFWALAASRPHEFVAPQRLPHGIVFTNPADMRDADFRVFYAHVEKCFKDRRGVDPASRFVYEPGIINRYVSIDNAHRLKARLHAKKREVGKVARVAVTEEADIIPAIAAVAAANAAAPDIAIAVASGSETAPVGTSAWFIAPDADCSPALGVAVANPDIAFPKAKNIALPLSAATVPCPPGSISKASAASTPSCVANPADVAASNQDKFTTTTLQCSAASGGTLVACSDRPAQCGFVEPTGHTANAAKLRNGDDIACCACNGGGD